MEYKKQQENFGNLPWISDCSELDGFDPELLEWLYGDWIIQLCEANVPQYAFVVPKDFFFRHDIDIYRKKIESINCNLEVRYFANLPSAQQWAKTQPIVYTFNRQHR